MKLKSNYNFMLRVSKVCPDYINCIKVIKDFYEQRHVLFCYCSIFNIEEVKFYMIL